MKKSIVILAVFFALVAPLKTAYNYLVSPVNCLVAYGTAVLDDTKDFGVCVYNNVVGNNVA